MALVRLAHPELDDSPEAIVTRLERLERSGVPSASPPPVAPAPAPAPAPPVAPAPVEPTGSDEPVPAPATGDGAGTVPAPVDAPPSPAPDATGDLPPARPSLKAIREGRAASPAAPAPAERSVAPGPSTAPSNGGAAPGGPVGDQPAVDASSPPGGRPPSIDELTRAWNDHVMARLRPKAKALFLTGRFVGADDTGVRFGLPNEIHRQRCEDVRAEVEAAMGEQFGRPIRLVLVVDDQPRTDGGSRRDTSPEPAGEPRPRAGRPSADLMGPGPGDPSPAAPTVGPGGDEDDEDLSVFEDADVADATVDNSPEARLLQAFPGAEEVQ